jgi:hypothetical protein
MIINARRREEKVEYCAAGRSAGALHHLLYRSRTLREPHSPT